MSEQEMLHQVILDVTDDLFEGRVIDFSGFSDEWRAAYQDGYLQALTDVGVEMGYRRHVNE